MTLKQKRAISYAYLRKAENERQAFIKSHNLEKEFENSKYKTSYGFINNWKKTHNM